MVCLMSYWFWVLILQLVIFLYLVCVLGLDGVCHRVWLLA